MRHQLQRTREVAQRQGHMPVDTSHFGYGFGASQGLIANPLVALGHGSLHGGVTDERGFSAW